MVKWLKRACMIGVSSAGRQMRGAADEPLSNEWMKWQKGDAKEYESNAYNSLDEK